MMQPQQSTGPVTDRLSRFRQLMARVDAAGDPPLALDRDAYVPPPGPVATRIAGRLELRPASTHLVIGGVGSGKTTELLEARLRLADLPDVKPFYIDVSKDHDIGRMVSGVVAVQIALAIGSFVRTLVTARDREELPRIEGVIRQLEAVAHGHWYDPDSYEEYDDGSRSAYRHGVLVPPIARANALAEALALLGPLLDEIRKVGAHAVALIDGLDRMTDVAAFELVVDQDVKALASAGVGVVLVGPLKCLYGTSRVITESFDYFLPQPWHDPRADVAAKGFLTDVMRRRLSPDALDDQGLDALVWHSGGVLRDLIAIAQLACEEAYLGGVDTVGLYQVDSAIDAFGRKHMLGLQSDEVEVLQRVRTKGSFVQTSEKELALLMTRRVLEYVTDSGARYVVHPTIEPLLREMAGESR